MILEPDIFLLEMPPSELPDYLDSLYDGILENYEAFRTAAAGATSSEYSGTPLEKKIYKKIVDAVHPSDAAEDKIVQDLAKDIVKSILTDMGVIS